jgi:hypothetical protein
MTASPAGDPQLWWRGQRRERYWVVVEYRGDQDAVGDPLATKRDGAGNTPWHHRLVTEARVGDVVFHYEPWQQLVTHRSRVAGRARNGRRAGRPAWRLPISNAEPLVRPVSHQRLQDQVAKQAGTAGWAAHRARAIDPDYDLLVARGDTAVVVEVKSLTKDNEDRQMRLGLGQVLMYRHQLAASRPPGVRRVHAAIAVERRPTDSSWLELCKKLDVALAFPPDLSPIWER